MKCHYCKRPGIHTYDIGVIISVCTKHIKKAAKKERLYMAALKRQVHREAKKELSAAKCRQKAGEL